MSKRRKIYRRTGKRRVLAVKGTTETRAKRDPKKSRFVPETQQRTRDFMSKREKPITGPIVVNDRMPPHLASDFRQHGFTFQLYRDGIRIPVVVMSRHRVNLVDLNQLGIVIDRIPTTRDEVWAISTYDLMYLIISQKVSKDEKHSKQLFNDLYEWGNSQDPNFTEKYKVYLTAKEHGYVVLDGLRYGYDFVFYEEPSNELIEALNRIAPDKLGPRGKASSYSLAGVDVARQDFPMEMKEVIAGQHLADKSDMRYIIARVENAERDNEGHLTEFGGNTEFYGLRLNKLVIDKFNSPGTKTVILDRQQTGE